MTARSACVSGERVHAKARARCIPIYHTKVYQQSGRKWGKVTVTRYLNKGGNRDQLHASRVVTSNFHLHIHLDVPFTDSVWRITIWRTEVSPIRKCVSNVVSNVAK